MGHCHKGMKYNPLNVNLILSFCPCKFLSSDAYSYLMLCYLPFQRQSVNSAKPLELCLFQRCKKNVQLCHRQLTCSMTVGISFNPRPPLGGGVVATPCDIKDTFLINISPLPFIPSTLQYHNSSYGVSSSLLAPHPHLIYNFLNT